MRIATTFQTFKTKTGLDGNPDKRGPKLKVVDDAFKAYELNFNGAQNAGKITLTTTLFVACKDWLKAKEGKSFVKSRFMKPDKPNLNLINRREAMKTVAEECLAALAQLDPNLFLRTQFDLHKVRSLATGDRVHNARALSSGYNLERESWMNSGKTRAIAGSGLSDHVGRLKSKKKTSLSDLNLDDYKKLDQIAQQGQVQYLRKSERLDRMFVLNQQSLLCQATALGQPATLSTTPFPALNNLAVGMFGTGRFDNNRMINKLWMYAMDSYGNLFAQPAPDDPNIQQALGLQGFQFFNHSSFNAGREVTCAGLLYIEGGLLRWIDNNSGHYKPSPRNVQEALKLLAADGADVSGTVVGIGVYSNTGGLQGIQCFMGQDYLDNGHTGAQEFTRL